MNSKLNENIYPENNLNYLREQKNYKSNISKPNNNSQIFQCLQTNFTISSISKKSKNNSEKKTKNKIVSMYNTSIFIGGRQNLKSKRIHLSYNNTVHREITNFRNKKNKSVDRVNIQLVKKDYIEEIDIIKMMNIRWKNNLNVSKSDLTLINNKKDEIIFDDKKYIEEIINKININYKLNENNNNKEYFILLKHDIHNQNNNFIHEIILPKTKDDIESSINKFKEKKYIINNIDNNSDNLSNQENNFLSDGKKKSLFSKKNNNNNSNKENINNNIDLDFEEFSPIIILSQKDIINLYNIINPKRESKQKLFNYTINKFSIRYECCKTKKNFQSQANDNFLIKGKNIKKYNFFPINVDNFELTNIIYKSQKFSDQNIESETYLATLTNNYKSYNKELMNLELYSSANKKEKDKDIDIEKSIQDFGQTTPISLLYEKYFIYAVSKWIKLSVPSPQNEIYINYNYKSDKILYEPTSLMITNFTLWIERIETMRFKNNSNSNIKGIIPISPNTNTNSNVKTKSKMRGKSLTYNKMKHGKIKINKSNNYVMGIDGSFIKPLNLKAKAFK